MNGLSPSLKPQGLTLFFTKDSIYTSFSLPVGTAHVCRVPVFMYVIKFGYFSLDNLTHIDLIIRPTERTLKGRGKLLSLPQGTYLD